MLVNISTKVSAKVSTNIRALTQFTIQLLELHQNHLTSLCDLTEKNGNCAELFKIDKELKLDVVGKKGAWRKRIKGDEVVKKKGNSGDYTRLKLNEFSKSRAEVMGFFVKGKKKMVMERKIECRRKLLNEIKKVIKCGIMRG
ncbi:13780_t:CDS:2 [Gigaspora margarita]|uniref:13780_t:CDS:1 n=1 Tax=Gigaspora margarita TaxID=4874 RepID=A0ABN7UG01_GIGMA|nr:13780_t:CDS:2 [Gigaspora margarita]